jgi:hypothetical protein
VQITDAQIRTWLDRLAKGRVVYDPELVAVMRAHGYGATGKTRAEVARDGDQFVRERVEALRTRPGASTREQMPHATARLWIEGWTSARAAKQLHVSERSLSRERSRAVALLRDALTPDVPAPSPGPTSWAELTAQLARIEATVAQIAASR